MHLTSICTPCRQTARDEKKADARWAVKARDVIRRHAVRLDISKDNLIGIYGWDPARLAHDAEHQYGNGCSYCGHKYADMGHGLSDITLDIMDRAKPPFYRTNTKWCCQTCNRQKGDRTTEWFEASRQVYEAWTQQQALTAEDRGMLFDLEVPRASPSQWGNAPRRPAAMPPRTGVIPGKLFELGLQRAISPAP